MASIKHCVCIVTQTTQFQFSKRNRKAFFQDENLSIDGVWHDSKLHSQFFNGYTTKIRLKAST